MAWGNRSADTIMRTDRLHIANRVASYMAKKILLSLASIIVILAAGVAVARIMMLNAPEPSQREVGVPPPLVQTVLLTPETITEKIIGYGSARAYRSATLTAEVGGEVVDVAEGLKDGSPVAAGALLVRLDDRRYVQTVEHRKAQAASDAARLKQLDVEEANLHRLVAIAERDVQVNSNEERRLARLFEDDNASKREYDFARLALNRSLREETGYQNQIALIAPQREQLQASARGRRAEISLAQLDVERCRITAPFDGQIDELAVEVGETVQRGSIVARVIDPLQIEIPLELPASAYARVEIGTTVELRSDSMPGRHWAGTVERISPDADEQSRTFRAYIVVDNRAQASPLVAGYFLRAEVAGPTWQDVLLVPRGAVVDGHVFVVNDLRTHRREVHVERHLGNRAVITGDVRRGDAIVVTNLDMLQEDGPVRVDDAADNG